MGLGYAGYEVGEEDVGALLVEGVEGYGADGAVVGVEVDREEEDEGGPGCGFGSDVGYYYAANKHTGQGNYSLLG